LRVEGYRRGEVGQIEGNKVAPKVLWSEVGRGGEVAGHEARAHRPLCKVTPVILHGAVSQEKSSIVNSLISLAGTPRAHPNSDSN